ncbi:MAG: phosphate-selective porin OprO/OprP [Rickettsiales bacterium]|jgi:phosphate-selective porin OprO/OprP
MKKILATITICASMIGGSNAALANNAELESRIKVLEERLASQERAQKEFLEKFQAKYQQEFQAKYQENPQINPQANPQINPQANPQINPQANNQANPQEINTQQQIPAPLLKAFKSAKIIGRLHIDSRFHDESSASEYSYNDGIEIIRARLGMQGKLSDNFSYKLENDFSRNESRLTDAYIAYDGIANTQFKVGHFRQFFSLETLTSSNDITFLYRSIASDESPPRAVGFGAQTHGENWQISAGIFGDSIADSDREDDSAYSASIRASIAPINSNGKLIHFGLATSTSSKDRDKKSGESEEIDQENLYGAELALGLDSLSLQGEYIINKTNYDNDALGGAISTTGKSATYKSYYAQISYILTGESRVYDYKTGTYEGVKIKKSVDEGGVGALELAARFSENDRNKRNQGENFIGGKTQNITLGVNWYLNQNLRLMANYMTSRIDQKTSSNDKINSFLLRAQVNF